MNISTSQKLRACLIGLGLLLNTSLVFSQQLDYKSLQSSIQAVVKKVSGATVAVSGYDTLKNRVSGLTFSAVVVSKDGIILTAAHAAKPHQIYQVAFPDGKKVLAIGLGSNNVNDAAIIKIMSPGNWPYAEMGWSGNLVPFQPCISMGYPQNMKQSGHALVRFGYITKSNLNEGFLCNTALMEPGDSGGPLFDLNGKVIGIHSRIFQSLDANYEVPMDTFRQYWDKLLKPQTYFVADSGDSKKLEAMPPNKSKPIPALENMHENFPAVFSRIAPTSFNIASRIKGEEITALGALIALPVSGFNDKSFIISKSSIVGNDSVFVSFKEESFPATAIARDSLKDLVLLEVAAKLKNGIDIVSGSFSNEMYKNAGTFLLSPGANYGAHRVSVLSSPTVGFIPYGWKSYLGISAIEKDNALLINSIDPYGPAASAKLKTGDQIQSINGVKVTTCTELEWQVSAIRPSTPILLKGKRKWFGYTKKITLKQKSFSQPLAEHMAEQFEGGKSERKDGFKKAFSHDARLYPSECGGPVFDGEGNFMGINISRISRTTSLAIPAEEVKLFLKNALKL
ncbi:trypsin-like peptidase domain-containing protein [Pseudoflavitalea rhizosphaerae]|uniref:trypsin-like peptidase domain-containing protein n=1 Tax=Pseudoflavitalea rhizosphaerae TaxID=1884793 RepID=UPI0013E061ED|nr:trypsin-like peptidase domain-containing protein [Pseudoflavitalea rhizosphaerae]